MAKLGDFYKITSGGTPSRSHEEYYENGSIPWVKTGDLKSKYLSKTEEKISELGLESSSARIYPQNTVLLAMYGATIGAASILKIKAATNQACAAFVPREDILPEYLYAFLESRKERFTKDAVGGAQPNLSAGYLKSVSFDCASLEKQKKVTKVLNGVDDLISLRKRQLTKLDELIKARFAEMFTANERNFPMTALNDLCKEIFAGGDKPSEMSQIQTDEFEFPVYANGYENLGLQGFAKNYRIEEKSVTISARGTIGYSFIREGRYTPIVRLITAVPGDKLNVAYLKYSIDMLDIKSSGTSQAQLTVPNFKKIKIMEPPLSLQNDFAVFVERVDQQKQTVQQSLKKLELLKKALMQEYFG